MNKFPLLEQMRNDRAQRDKETIEPYKRSIAQLDYKLCLLKNENLTFKKIHASKITDHIHEKIGYELANSVIRKLDEVIMKAKGPFEPVNVIFNLSDISYLGMHKFANRIMREYSQHVVKTLSFDAYQDVRERKVIVFCYNIPQIEIKQAMEIEE